MARTQTLVQLTDDLLALLDEHAARERRSRSELIRDAIEHYLRASRDAEIDRAIVAGYTSRPQEGEWSDVAARDLLRDEPW